VKVAPQVWRAETSVNVERAKKTGDGGVERAKKDDSAALQAVARATSKITSCMLTQIVRKLLHCVGLTQENCLASEFSGVRFAKPRY
jgi:hypothetical protein